MKKIAVIFGTRPDTIKLVPLILELQKYQHYFSIITVATAQHREMLDDVLFFFKIKPTYDLNVMTNQQTLTALSVKLMGELERIISSEKPDLIIVQGDTTTTFIAGIIGFYHKIPIAHVEAGLRTYDNFNPFPEEINRKLISHIADIHFTATASGSKHLLKEGILKKNIYCSGNTVIDALQLGVKRGFEFSLPILKNIIDQKKKYIVVTCHRRENWGDPMKQICEALKELSFSNPDMNFIFPVHPNPVVGDVVRSILDGLKNVYILGPLNYPDFINLMSKSYFVITDSGGLQEEAPSLGKPVLVLRKVTERPEAVKYGTVKLVGVEKKKIVQHAQRLISDKKFYKSMATAVNPYGDGKASARIISALLHYFGLSKKGLKEFAHSDK